MDEGLLFHGVDASVSAGTDYGPSRALALALHDPEGDKRHERRRSLVTWELLESLDLPFSSCF
jgi:hypothetical protein